ncbi:MAG: chorismate mutase [Chloroflexi bacterium]|nr:chorismate mutase [Chloroflexota bacterium]
MAVRGIRGATTITEDEEQSVLSATRELLLAILKANPTLKPEDVGSIFFTVTEDIRSAHPARAAREMGWNAVPLMCMQEIPVPGSLPHCIRVMILWNTDLAQKDIHHVYLRQAVQLRPDLAAENLQ